MELAFSLTRVRTCLGKEGNFGTRLSLNVRLTAGRQTEVRAAVRGRLRVWFSLYKRNENVQK